MLISKTTSIEGLHDIMPGLHHAPYYVVVLTNHSLRHPVENRAHNGKPPSPKT